MKIERQIEKTVDRILDRRCLWLFGCKFAKASEAQQNICMLLFNLFMWPEGITISRSRARSTTDQDRESEESANPK